MRAPQLLAFTIAVGLAHPARADPGPAERAAPAANQALDRAYAAFAKRPHVVAPVHRGAWVTADAAVVTGDAAHGFTVTWSHHPPAGYEIEAAVRVSPRGALVVVKAEASFSPD